MTTRMRMKLTIDVETNGLAIDEAFPPIRQKLIEMGLRPRAWTVEDLDAKEQVDRVNAEDRKFRRAMRKAERQEAEP